MPTIKIPTYQRQVYKQDKTINPQVSGPYSKQLLDNPMNESMQKAGQVTGKIAKDITEYEKRQKLKAEENMFLDYENKLNGFYDDVMYNEKSGLMFKKGQDSANLVEQLKEKKFEYKDDKGNIVEIPESLKERVSLAKDRIFTQKLKQVASYQVQEQQRYKDQLVNANINNEINNCINDKFTKKSFDKIDSIIDNNYSQLGKDILDFKKRQVRDDFATQRISLLLEVSNNKQAKQDLETIKDKISSQTYEKLNNAVRGGLIADYARSVFDELANDSVDDNGYILEKNIDDKIDNIKGEKFTPEEKEKMKNLVRSKANHLKYEINQAKATRQNEFQNSVAKMVQEGGHSEEEFEKVAIGYASTPLEQQVNLKYINDLFKKNTKSDPDTVTYLWDRFNNNTITRSEIEQEYNNGNLSQAIYISMLKKYDKDTLSSKNDNYARWKEINARITDFAKKNKNNDFSETDIKNELIQSVINLDYVEANKELDRITKEPFFGKPIYKKEIINRRELEQLQSVIDQDLKNAGIDKSKLVNLLQEGIGDTGKVNLDYMQQFIRNNIGLNNLRDPKNNSLEVRVLRSLIEQKIPLTQDIFDKAMELAKEQQ